MKANVPCALPAFLKASEDGRTSAPAAFISRGGVVAALFLAVLERALNACKAAFSSLCQRFGKGVRSVEATRHRSVLDGSAGQVALPLLVELQASARLAEEVDARHESRRAAQQRTRDFARACGIQRAFCIAGGDRDRIELFFSVRLDDGGACVDGDSFLARDLDDFRSGFLAPICDHDLCADFFEGERCSVSGIVVSCDHGIEARQDSVASHAGADRIGEHDARQIVVGKYHVPLACPCRQQNMACTDAPQAFARQVGVVARLRNCLDGGEKVSVEIAARAGVGEDGEVSSLSQQRNPVFESAVSGFAIDGDIGICGEEGAAELPILLDEGDAQGLVAADDLGGLEPCDTAANDEHIGKMVRPFAKVCVRAFGFGRFAQTRRTADEVFVDSPRA